MASKGLILHSVSALTPTLVLWGERLGAHEYENLAYRLVLIICHPQFLIKQGGLACCLNQTR
jgi:hypothetical protein